MTRTVRIANSDVCVLRVTRNKHGTRIAIYQHGERQPLIHVVLTRSEERALRATLTR